MGQSPDEQGHIDLEGLVHWFRNPEIPMTFVNGSVTWRTRLYWPWVFGPLVPTPKDPHDLWRATQIYSPKNTETPNTKAPPHSPSWRIPFPERYKINQFVSVIYSEEKTNNIHLHGNTCTLCRSIYLNFYSILIFKLL